jgi:hypothetical protein
MLWRLVLDPRIPDGLADLRRSWSLTDVVHGHELLDQLDAREASRASLRGA